MPDVLSRKTETLECKLNEDELLDRGQQLARVDGELREHKSHADQVKSQLKADEARLDSERHFLASCVRNKSEPRSVEVECVLDSKNRRRVLEIRLDTGEVVRSRAAREDELQRDLPLGAEA